MLAILGGLGAAISWAVSTLASTRTTRIIGAPSVLAWVMVVGLVVSIGPALAGGLPVADPGTLLMLLVVGISYNAGLLLAYAALTRGRVSIVAPIVATEGAAAAAISVALGDPMSIQVGVILVVLTIGVVLSAIERGEQPADRDPRAARDAVLLSIASSIAFSVGLVVAAKVGGLVPVVWVVVASRTVGTLGIALPLLLLGRLRLTRATAPLVVASGILEATGTISYVLGAQHGVAVAAVLSSQFAALAAVGAFFLYRERLQPIQIVGVVMLVVGVSALAFVRA